MSACDQDRTRLRHSPHTLSLIDPGQHVWDFAGRQKASGMCLDLDFMRAGAA